MVRLNKLQVRLKSKELVNLEKIAIEKTPVTYNTPVLLRASLMHPRKSVNSGLHAGSGKPHARNYMLHRLVTKILEKVSQKLPHRINLKHPRKRCASTQPTSALAFRTEVAWSSTGPPLMTTSARIRQSSVQVWEMAHVTRDICSATQMTRSVSIRLPNVSAWRTEPAESNTPSKSKKRLLPRYLRVSRSSK